MSGLGHVHLIGAWIALASGLINLILAKGTRGHRALGYGFVFCMILTNATALSLYRLTGHFNMFHMFALVSLAATLWAMVPVWRRGPGWLMHHQRAMQGSYIGLCAAAANEILTRFVQQRIEVSRQTFWMISILVTVLVWAAGLLLVRRGGPLQRPGAYSDVTATPS